MEENIDKLQILLNEVGTANAKYKKEKPFNIFPILRKPHDEVYLHSRFIFELLNPNGMHNQGSVFLEFFLDEIRDETKQKIEGFDVKNVEVWNEKKNIDLLIQNNEKAIIIENKIYAPDQKHQLARYYREIIKNYKEENIWIFYLTLDGHSPSDRDGSDSLGKNLSPTDKKEKLVDVSEKYFCITYPKTIKRWMEKCINKVDTILTKTKEEIESKSALIEILKQYLNLVIELINQEMREDIKKIILNDFKSANTIANNIEKVKIEVVDGFLDELEIKLKGKLDLGWKVKLYDNKKDKKEWRSLKIEKETIKISLQGQSLFHNNETILGFPAKKGSEKREGITLNKYLKKLYPNESFHWLFYRSVFNFGNIDEFRELLEKKSRNELLEKVSDEVLLLLENIRKCAQKG